MKLNTITLLLILLLNSKGYGQNTSVKIFGNTLAKSIIENDSLLFRSLIIPKEAMIQTIREDFSSKMTKENEEKLIEGINEKYDQFIAPTFILPFSLLTSKAGIHNLKMDHINYELVETRFSDSSPNIKSVHGILTHKKLQHFTFHIIKYQAEWYLLNGMINISETNKLEEYKEMNEITLSSDRNGFLQSEGTMKLKNKNASKIDIFNCILNSVATVGVTETSKINEDLTFIKGTWEYKYWVNDTDTPVGKISFKYEFIINDSSIHYRYYNYVHRQADSEFTSINQLPLKANEKTLAVFTKDQYDEMLYDTLVNIRHSIRSHKKLTDKCLQ